MSPEQLGTAELTLDTDQAPLIRGLAEAEARVAKSVAVMQAMMDKLHADVQSRIGVFDALGSRAAGGLLGPNAGSAAAPPGRTQGETNQIWGIRGPQHPGSMQNPIVTVIEAAKYTPMGSYAAAIGESNASDVQRGDQGSGVASAADLAALTAAVQDLARHVNPASQLAKAGMVGMAEPHSAERVVVALDQQDRQAFKRMADTLEGIKISGGSGGGGDHTVIVDRGGGGGGAPPRIIVAGPGGGGGGSGGNRTLISGPGGDNTVRLDGGQYAGLISAIVESGQGRVGNTILAGDSTKRVDIFYHADPLTGTTGGAAGSAGLLAMLGIGKGAFGTFAGVGTAAGFAGLGLEHAIFTALGILGSAGAAVGGGGLLAAGAAGTIGVGAGSDLAVLKSTITDTQTLSKDMTALSQAQAVYGKNSTQAAQATAQLNADMAALGNTAGVKAEAGLAKAGQQLDHFFDLQTSSARVQAVKILMQGVSAGYTFVPLIADAALRNLTIINNSLKPLFEWLKGPQGIQIFNDLENMFASHLPTAMQAFTQGVELLLRVVNIAAQYTGGFVNWLDKLFTRLNGESTGTLQAEVGKLIGDFRLWETFVKLLVTDIYLLFHQDVGTGNSIIATLNGMLEKLHAYELSARGSAQIQNIFEVHKTEILDLLHIIAQLAKAAGGVYLAIAPPLVTVMNNIILPALTEIAKLLATIANISPVAGSLMGLFLISGRAFGFAKVLGVLGSLAGVGGGAAVAGGAAAAGGGSAAAISAGQLAAAGGAGGGLVATAAAAATAAIPIVLGGVALATIINAASTPENQAHFRSAATGQEVINPRVAAFLGPHAAAAAAIPSLITPGNVAGAAGLSASALSNQTVDIQKLGNYSNYSASQLRDLVKVLKEAGGVKIDGVSESIKQVRALAAAALHAKDVWNASFNQVWTLTHERFANIHQSLTSLQDAFASNMKLIAHDMGINSEQGRKAVASNIGLMVRDVTVGMLSGRISVSQGMAAIRDSLRQGMHDGAITWNTQWKDMFATVVQLYAAGKINTKTYLNDLASLNKTGLGNITASNKKELSQQLTDLKTQQQDGLITQAQYNARAHQLRVDSNNLTSQDMAAFVATQANAMQASGQLTAKGMQLITRELNSALGLLGANKLPIPEAIAWANFQITGAAGSGSGPGKRATGGMMVNHPTYIVGEEGPTHPEYVLATNPAYRDRNMQLWARAGHDLGVPGFATGGYVYPNGPGAVGERIDQGKDFGGAFNIAAMGSGVITDATTWGGGWGPGGIVYRLTDGVRAGRSVYTQEGVAPFARIGERVSAGDIIARAFGSPHGVEEGWANAAGTGPLTPYNGRADGTAMPGGVDYAGFIAGLARGVLTGGAGLAGLGSGSLTGSLGAAWKNLTSPKVSGSGALSTIINAALGLDTKSANAYGQAHGGGSGPSSGGFTGSLSGPVERQVYEFMSASGFNKTAVAGMLGNALQESGMNPNTPGGGFWQQITNFGAGTGGSLLHQMQVMLPQILGLKGQLNAAGSPGAAATIFMQDFERPAVATENLARRIAGANAAFAAGFAEGGIIPGYATGVYNPNAVSASFPKKGHPAPKGAPKPKGNASEPRSGPGAIGEAMRGINHILNNEIPYLTGEYNYLQGVNSGAFGSAQFVVSQDSQGNPVTPFIDWATVNADLAQLEQLYLIESQIKGDYQSVLLTAASIVKAIRHAIQVRQALIAAAKKKIRENLVMLAALHKQLGKKGISGKQKGALNASISQLEASNKSLGGNTTSIGTGGKIGSLTTQIGNLNTDLSTVSGYLPGGSSALEGLFNLDPNFPIGGADSTLAGLSSQIGALSPAALQQALTVADNQAGGTTSSQDTLISLLQQQLQTSNEALYVSQQQYGVLANLPPFGGSFAMGGIVPGPPGAARTVIAHGGEAIGQGGNAEIHIHGLGDFVDRVESVIGDKRQDITGWVDHDLGSRSRARRLLPTARGLAMR